MCEEFEVISHGNMDYNIFLNNLLYRTPHVHKEFEVCLLLDGSVQLLSPSSSRAFSAGSLWVINPFESHELIAERPALILSLQIAPAFFSGIFPQMENIEFSLSPAAGGDEISSLAASLLEIARTYFSPEEYAPLRCAGLICLFFEQLLEAAPTRCISEKERQSSANRAQRIRTISAYIDRHYSEKLLLTDLARELGLTMGYLSAFFKSAFGLSFQSYVRKLRCEKARQLLLCTDLSLLDISLACGFSDLKYFNQGFAQQFGCSPPPIPSGCSAGQSCPAAGLHLHHSGVSLPLCQPGRVGKIPLSPAPHLRLGSLRPEHSAAPEHMTQFQGGRADISICKMRVK